MPGRRESMASHKTPSYVYMQQCELSGDVTSSGDIRYK